jgi:hypothetical protein
VRQSNQANVKTPPIAMVSPTSISPKVNNDIIGDATCPAFKSQSLKAEPEQ